MSSVAKIDVGARASAPHDRLGAYGCPRDQFGSAMISEDYLLNSSGGLPQSADLLRNDKQQRGGSETTPYVGGSEFRLPTYSLTLLAFSRAERSRAS